MLHSTVLLIATLLLGGTSAARAQTPTADPNNCQAGGLGCTDGASEQSINIVVTAQVQVFSDEGLDDGGVRELLCPDGQVRLIREATVDGITAAEAPADGSGAGDVDGVDDGTATYSGGRCASGDVRAGSQLITSAQINAQLDLPGVVVNHNPHSDVLVANLPTWFWHTGSTTHTQSVAVPLDSGGAITGTWSGRITAYCWTVDDTRGQLATRPLEATACTASPGLTTYRSPVPGTDSEQGAGATHTFTTRGYDTTITHEVVWTGTWTITNAPAEVIETGLTLGVTPTVIRAQTTLPVGQIIPVLVPGEDD